MKFSPAPEVAQVAQPIIREFHPHLSKNDVRMIFIFFHEPKHLSGQVLMAQTHKITGLQAFLADAGVDSLCGGDVDDSSTVGESGEEEGLTRLRDIPAEDVDATVRRIMAPAVEPESFFVIAVYKEAWLEAADRPEWREALLDHQLAHCWAEFDDESEKPGPRLTILPHDLEEFKDVYARRGDWNGEFKTFFSARQAAKKEDAKNKPDDKAALEAAGQQTMFGSVETAE